MLARIEAWLARPRAPLWLGLAAVLLCLPALPQGRQADDELFPWKLDQGAPAWSMFEIEPQSVPSARQRGYVVWWSSPQLSGRFLRPIASLSHALDFTLWPEALWWMHLCNALVYGACVALAALLYRRLAPSSMVAGLAALLFAIDDSHAVSAGWISGRNTLLAALFSLLALWLHIEARARASRGRALLAAASVGLALASAEAGVGALALLVSYALTLESGSLGARLRSVAAPLCVGAIWAVVYVALGCGFRGSSFYRDPADPTSLARGLADLPVWFADMFGPSGFPAALLYPALWVRVALLPAALLLAFLLLPALRASRACRFFALAFALGLLPLLYTLPTSRVLLGPSFAALGWVACSIALGRGAASGRGRWTARILLTFHLWFAALLFVPALGSTRPFAYGTRRVAALSDPGHDVILLQSPVELLSNYVMLRTTRRGASPPPPASVHQLYTGSSAVEVVRVDARTLEMEVARGWARVPIERIFGAPEDVPRAGAEVHLPAFSARVLTSTREGMPQRVRFTFPTPLEDPKRTWLSWQGNRPLRWKPPRVGERVRFEALSFFGALSE